ncbi:MAG TPA: hypothetical protein VN231_06810 [Allosphingosinicella sp.]|nr:hypothetical protein [Allosphingosinicella sp.]
MKVAVDPPRGRLARGDVPAPFVAAIASLVEDLPEIIAEVRVELRLRNSLAMESAVYLDADQGEAAILLDWAQCERLPIVIRRIDRDRPLYEQKDRLRDVFSREQRVYWRRRLALLSPNEIGDYDRHYDGARGKEKKDGAEPPAPYDDGEISAAARYAFYLLGHEIGHLIADANPSLARENYRDFEQRYPRLIRPSAGLPDELVCDRLALDFIASRGAYRSTVDLNDEFSLIMAIERLQNEARAAAPRIHSGLNLIEDRENRIPFSGALEDRVVTEWRFRMFQIDLMLEAILDSADCDAAARAEAARVRAALSTWAEESLHEDYMGLRH